MRLDGLTRLVVLLLALQGGSSHALVVDPAFAALGYTATDLGAIVGLPPSYGGMVFKAGDPNTLLVGGQANLFSGLLYEVPVIRDAQANVTGFGPVSAFGTVGEYNDGGVAYGPGGVLFTAQWPQNALGQTRPGSLDEDKVVGLAAFGITTNSSISGLGFVPAGFSGAGRFKVVSWAGGSWYDVALVADGSGTFDVVGGTLEAVVPGGPEGFVFIDDKDNPGFDVDSLLICDFSSNRVSVYDLDANGDPVVATRRDFVTGLTGAEGAAIDPLTGDFLFSTFQGGDRIVRVDGFAPPAVVPALGPAAGVVLAVALLGAGAVLAWRVGSRA